MENDASSFTQPSQQQQQQQQQQQEQADESAENEREGNCSGDASTSEGKAIQTCADEQEREQLIDSLIDRMNKFSVKADYDVDLTNGLYDSETKIKYVQYRDESQMPMIMQLIAKDLSEPYSIYTYRYFIHNWPYLCFLAMDCEGNDCDKEKEEKCVGVIVCKLDRYKDAMRGYIAMLDVDASARRKKIGTNLVSLALKRMILNNADEIVLETEVTNKAALKLYENLGFVRDKRLFRYYLNGVEAFRLKLWLR